MSEADIIISSSNNCGKKRRGGEGQGEGEGGGGRGKSLTEERD